MERAPHFRIKDGRAFAPLFPPATGENETVDRDADLSKTLDVLPKVVEKYGWQAAKVAKRLQGRTRRECARKIWEFCYGYFQYHKDEPGTEQIRTPARAWADREAGIDCDCFSVLAASLLRNMRDPETRQKGIPFAFRITKYYDPKVPDPPFQHIYVIVPTATGHIVIDPVMHQFNYEEPFIQKIDLPMELQILNGLSGSSAPKSIDQMEMFPTPGLGLPRGTKLARLQQEAAAKGMSLEAYISWKQQQFQDQHGMSTTEYVQREQDKLNQHLANSQAQEAEVLAKLKAELTRRGIAFAPNANRDQLLALLRSNPQSSVPSKIINTVNKANPGATLLRQGLLLGMKTNLMQVAEKMRWALVSPAEAKAAGMSAADHQKLTKAWQALKKIHFNAGGKIEKLAGAILTGKGNQDKAVALAGLGEPVTAGAALAAATAALGTVAAIIKNIKTPNKVSGGPVQIDPGSLDTTGIDTNNTEKQGDIMAINSDNPPQTGVWAWIKANPIPVIGATGLVVVAGGYGIYRARRKKPAKKGLSGTRKRLVSRDKKGRYKKVRIT